MFVKLLNHNAFSLASVFFLRFTFISSLNCPVRDDCCTDLIYTVGAGSSAKQTSVQSGCRDQTSELA